MHNEYGQGYPFDVGCHRLLKSWEEMECTWNVRKTGVPWAAPGLQAGYDYREAAESVVTVTGHTQWFEWDVTEYLGDVWEGKDEGHGVFFLVYEYAALRWSQWFSRHYLGGTMGPFLEMVW
jgi:hypothetical protein